METIKQIFMQHAFSSLKLSLVIILLFALTKPIVKRYTAGFRYYSWLAVMLVFSVPFTATGMGYTMNLSAVTDRIDMQTVREWYGKNAPEYSVTGKYVKLEPVQNQSDNGETQYIPVTKTTTMKTPVDIAAILSLLWIAGAIGCFTLHIARHIRFKHGMRRLCGDIDDERIFSAMDTEKQKLGISKMIPLKLFPVTDTPMLTGLFRPEIILPRADYTDDELRLIFRHELFHWKRKDILYQLITLIFVSLHWFNPFVYLMARAIEIDGETSCDEKTLEGKMYEERIFYGEMLLKFLKTTTQRKSYMTTTFFGGVKGMKKRLNLIKSKSVRRKGTAAMAALTAITVALSISAAAMESDYFNSIFKGDTSYLADFIKTEKRSVEDDRFKLTLEQYLVAENQAMLICSFEAKTEDARQEMYAVDERGNSTFCGMDFLNFGPTDYENADCTGYSTGSLGNGKFDTENKRYFVLKSDMIENESRIDFALSTDRIQGHQKIIFPMDYNMETKQIEFDDIKVEYNPISIKIDFPVTDTSECESCEWYGTYFYFRMKNGEIKTFYRLYTINGAGGEQDENGNQITGSISAWTRQIIRPDEIISIIVNGKEYPIDDTTNPKPITLDEHLKPFKTSLYVKEHYWLPLRELCDGLGAEIEWDGEAQSATVKYRGSTYVFTVGSTQVQIDGVTVDFYDKMNDNAAFIDESGRMIVSPKFDDYMCISCHSNAAPWIPHDTYPTEMHIIP